MAKRQTGPSGKIIRVAGAALALLALLLAPQGGTPAATRLDESLRQLDSLAAAQERERTRLGDLARREEGGVKRLDQLEEQERARWRLCRSLEGELELLRSSETLQLAELAAGTRRLDSLDVERVRLETETARLRSETAALARRLFPLRRLDVVGLWLQSRNREEATRSMRRLPWLARGLQESLARLSATRSAVAGLVDREGAERERRQGLLAQLERDQRRAGRARTEADRELARLAGEREEQDRLLRSLREDRELAARQADRLRHAGEEVARQLADLQRRWDERASRREQEERRQTTISGRLAGSVLEVEPVVVPERPPSALPRLDRAPTGGLAARRGRLPLPVKGWVARPFGERQDPLLGTVLDNPGVDFACAPGSPVQAVHAGRVEKLTWVAGFGETVLLAHGEDCWTVYAKLGEVAVREGQTVAAGEILGRAGRFEAPGQGSLHFELWQDRQARDPRQWLAP